MRNALLGVGLLLSQMAFAQTGEVKAAAVEGTVTFIGEIPKSTVTDDAGKAHDLLEVDGETRGLRDVVVYLTRGGSAIARERNQTAKSLPQKPVMDQADYAFAPRVLAVQEGEPVIFTNSDPANHNVRTTASNKTNEFNVFTGVDGKYEHRFVVEPQYRPVRVGCDIHPWMRGWIFVFDHPYFGLTDQRGRFRISGVPPGEYQLDIKQPDIGHSEQRKVNLSANETAKVEVVIHSDPTKRP